MQMLRFILAIFWKQFKLIYGQGFKTNLVMSVCFSVLMIRIGTPVMLKAKELGISPEDLIKDVQRIMKRPISFMILILQIITQHIQMRIKNILKKFT